MQLPAAVCYTDALNCPAGGMTTTLPRPTSIEACCDNGGVSFDSGVGECINCPGRHAIAITI